MLVFLMESRASEGLFNVDTDEDLTIHELAETVMDVAGFNGEVLFDASKPGASSRQLLKSIGWIMSVGKPQHHCGIAKAYADFLIKVAN